MKKAENLKSAIMLLVATGVAIGLLSSTAVKLASATNLLKQTESLSSVKVAGDAEETTEETTEDTTADSGSNDTTAPSGGNGGSAGAGDNGGSGDSGSGSDSGSGDSGSGGSSDSGGGILDTIMGLVGSLGDIDLGGLLGGGSDTPEEETPGEDAPVDNSAEFKSIMTSYKAVVEKAKLGSVNYTKTTERTIEWNFLNDLFIGKAGDISVDGEKYFNNTVTVSGITNQDPSFIINNRFACLINTLDEGAIDEAVKSAQKTALDDGNAKIVIVFNDESNPEALGYNDVAPSGFISSVLPVLSADQIKVIFNEGMTAGLNEVNVTYTDCSVEVVYNPTTGDIISLVQVINYDVDASGTKSFSTTITEVNTYTF